MMKRPPPARHLRGKPGLHKWFLRLKGYLYTYRHTHTHLHTLRLVTECCLFILN